MKRDIIIAGVGGQGILSIAATIGYAAIDAGMYLKQSEVHGMSQRGGDVQSNLRISHNEIASDLIPQGKADMIIAVEPMEALRHLHMIAPEGWLISNTTPYVNITSYPNEADILNEIKKMEKHILIDADKIAKDLGNAKVANMVILGAAIRPVGLSLEQFEGAVSKIFRSKGPEVIETNVNALKAGYDFAADYSA